MCHSGDRLAKPTRSALWEMACPIGLDPIQSTSNWLGVRATAAIAPGDAQPGGAIAHGLTQLPCGSGHVVGITTQGRVLTIRVAVQHTDIVMLEF